MDDETSFLGIYTVVNPLNVVLNKTRVSTMKVKDKDKDKDK